MGSAQLVLPASTPSPLVAHHLPACTVLWILRIQPSWFALNVMWMASANSFTNLAIIRTTVDYLHRRLRTVAVIASLPCKSGFNLCLLLHVPWSKVIDDKHNFF